MSKRTSVRQYVKFDGMTWPGLGRLAELEHELRYGPTPNLVAAGVVSAYRTLLLLPNASRNRIANQIKQEPTDA
jgi:hypothetical protein